MDPSKSMIVYARVKLPTFGQRSKQLGGPESGPGPKQSEA
jgi:hypothetical protein